MPASMPLPGAEADSELRDVVSLKREEETRRRECVVALVWCQRYITQPTAGVGCKEGG